ncbi:hypothetical protein TSH100_23650 [Azospirillum sp. TSH100]|uniref:hypothetical protein n=1 Tax=Azospirillum sp. TSH100 TaxID=652764 RepID=UPI000D615BFF|nr:hypothetical protein [Azospirillum sp. TSH100]PWC82498.1 hypothetical protein TSH100_23650 [Azospirillum sp. TSH100]QCG89040.1 hypothetical protein E6C72_14555 [Azospirillum sp. TSH100]
MLSGARQGRRNDIINLTMTEVMILMVFAAMAFSFLAREEGMREADRLRAQVSVLEAERDRLAAENLTLTEKIHDLEKSLADLERLVAQLPPQDNRDHAKLVILPASQLDQLNSELARKQQSVVEQKRLIEELSKKLAKEGKGTGLPRCPTPAGFLVEATLLADGGYSFQKAWEPKDDEAVLALPGITGLLSGGRIASDEVRLHAQALFDWGNAQEVPCRFHVSTKVQRMDLDMFLRMLNTLETYFYVRKPKR